MDLLLHEGTFEPRLSVRVRVPGLFLDGERRRGQEPLEPTREMGAHVVDLVGELTGAAGAVGVRLVDKDLHAGLGALKKRKEIFIWDDELTSFKG